MGRLIKSGHSRYRVFSRDNFTLCNEFTVLAKGKSYYLTAEQAARLIEAAKQDQNLQIYLFITIGLETAIRRMEILSIKIE